MRHWRTRKAGCTILKSSSLFSRDKSPAYNPKALLQLTINVTRAQTKMNDDDVDFQAAKRQRRGSGDQANVRAKLAAALLQQQRADDNDGDGGDAEEQDEPTASGGAHHHVPMFSDERADEGQDFDHTLAVNELEWEQSNKGRMIPPGWAKCRNIGEEIHGLYPMKAPIGRERGQNIPKAYQWKPSDVIQYFEEVQGRRLGLVVDLTRTDKYYDHAKEFESQGVRHLKIPCKGHSQVPGTFEVNTFYFEMVKTMSQLNFEWEQEKKVIAEYDDKVKEFALANGGSADPTLPGHPSSTLNHVKRKLLGKRDLVLQHRKVVAVHCTHGFNRTGYMIVHFLMRIAFATGAVVSVANAVKEFARRRPPGIYKDEYIQALFDYYHEERLDFGPDATLTPLVPAWKPDDGSPEHFADTEDAAADDDAADMSAEMKHDDDIGERICDEELQMYRKGVVEQVRVEYFRRKQAAGENDGHPGMRRAHRLEFPGSQPVSLSSTNQHLVQNKRYWFTWKADGTRYLMWLTAVGTYLIDRRLNVSRVQARFPVWERPEADFMAAFRAGRLTKGALKLARLRFHMNTLLDGEMVVDTYPDGRQVRAFYVYDLLMLNGVDVMGCPWKERFMFMREVTEPRDYERSLIADPSKKWPHRYRYDAEPFSVKIKQFWPLHQVASVFRNVVPNLRHENDGIILQCYTSEYVPDACDDLLKWKPASHNSVDFMLLPGDDDLVTNNDAAADARAAGQAFFLGVSQMGKVVLAFDLDRSLQRTDKPAAVRFPDGVDPMELIGLVVECNWDYADATWCYMRERSKDKILPNAWNTYVKVVGSIYDAIGFEDIQEQFVCSYRLNFNHAYDKDIRAQAEAQARAAKQAKQQQHVQGRQRLQAGRPV